MNVIKKYWNSVYIYILLLVPGLCMCAGLYWSVCKAFGLYPALSWTAIILFDLSQCLYLAVSLYFIYRNTRDSSFIPEHLIYVKGFIIFALFIQYNFILYLFSSVHVWECTFLFFAVIVFLFDSKLMLINILSYSCSLVAAHLLRPEKFLPLDNTNITEFIAYRFIMLGLTSFSIMLIVYFAERFLIQARADNEENIRLMEKQLENYKNMDLLDTELRKFRHDIKNHFLCMETLLKNKKTEELETYFQDLQQSFSFQKNIFFSGNDIVDAILHQDLANLCREEVNVSVNGTLPEINTISAMDLCTLFSNLLANAITSANRCVGIAEPQLLIHFAGGKYYFSITISNSFVGSFQPDSKNKNRNHGFGMYKIQNVIEKYDGRIVTHTTPDILSITVYLPI